MITKEEKTKPEYYSRSYDQNHYVRFASRNNKVTETKMLPYSRKNNYAIQVLTNAGWVSKYYDSKLERLKTKKRRMFHYRRGIRIVDLITKEVIK